MTLTILEKGLIGRLARGIQSQNPAIFGGRHVLILQKLIEAKILKESAVEFWLTTPGATQNLGEEDFLGEEGKAYFIH